MNVWLNWDKVICSIDLCTILEEILENSLLWPNRTSSNPAQKSPIHSNNTTRLMVCWLSALVITFSDLPILPSCGNHKNCFPAYRTYHKVEVHFMSVVWKPYVDKTISTICRFRRNWTAFAASIFSIAWILQEIIYMVWLDTFLRSYLLKVSNHARWSRLVTWTSHNARRFSSLDSDKMPSDGRCRSVL